MALFTPPFAAWHYRLPDSPPASSITPGTRVGVPVGNALRAGMALPADAAWDRVAGAPVEPPEGLTLKPLLWPLERSPLLSAKHLDVLRQLALRQGLLVGQVLANILPAALRREDMRFELRGQGRRRWVPLKEFKTMDAAQRLAMALAWEEGRLLPHDEDRESLFCWVTADPPWPVRPAAVKQWKILERLWERGPTPRPVLLAALPQHRDALDALTLRGLVAEGEQPPGGGEEDDARPCPDDGAIQPAPPALPDLPVLPVLPVLNGEQQAALAMLVEALRAGKGEARLLHGVTGSGKTTVYLALAREALAQGRSVLLLAPEVALACNLHAAARRAFPHLDVVLHHGYQTPARRARQFRETARREAAAGPLLVVGTRSALFLPLPDLGCIVLDEEHDASFKQEDRLPYQAKEVAHAMAKVHGALLVLGSATPDVKSYHAATVGALPMASLTRRFGEAVLPEVSFLDIRGQAATDSLLHPQALEQVVETVSRGEQAIILLNRRGYAPAMCCRDCGHVLSCPHCQISFTYHKGRQRLLCHYCGESLAWPALCPQCGGVTIIPLGEGTEQMEEALTGRLRRLGGVLRLDRDATRRPGRLEEILHAFARKEASVLVGTQMLSKGHDFPDVTQVVVADADMGLNLPDFRAAERSFQLLMQVAGRAGRGSRKGRVTIQTRDPDHYCFQFLRRHDYLGFYQAEIERRRKWRYPPFVKLGLVRVSFPAEWDGQAEALARLAALAREAGREHGVQALGPAPAPLAMLQGRKRFQLLCKAEDWPRLRAFHAAIAAPLRELGREQVRLSLDLDPLDML